MDDSVPDTHLTAPPRGAVLRGHMMSVIIPANNEEGLIGACLSALLASDLAPVDVEIIVVANGCTDATVATAREYAPKAHGRDWGLTVLDLPEGGKPAALNAADRVARGRFRAYLDADVTVSPALIGQLCAILDREEPIYASGTLNITAPENAVSRAYARLWAKVPFMARGVPGCGLFAVNGPGRARWDGFPAIISDDTFVRLHFTPDERHAVPARYDWPIAPGFDALVRVRRRQDRGVQQVTDRYPALLMNDDKVPTGLLGMLGLLVRDPVGFAVYAAVALAVRTGRSAVSVTSHVNGPDSGTDSGTEWSRSR